MDLGPSDWTGQLASRREPTSLALECCNSGFVLPPPALHRFWGLNSDPDTSIARTLPTEPSPALKKVIQFITDTHCKRKKKFDLK